MRIKRRKRSTPRHVLPWWCGAAFGVAGYFLAAHVAPSLVSENALLAGFAMAMQTLALPWLIFASGLSALALAGQAFRARLFDRTTTSDHIRALTWQQFEQLAGEYFRRRGFSVREVGSPAGDGGVDLLLVRSGERHVVQCKHWRSRQVGVSVVRELIGTVQLTGAAKGYLVISGAVTQTAAEAARDGDVEVISSREILSASSRIARSRGSALLWQAGAAGALLVFAAVALYQVPQYIAAALRVTPATQDTTSGAPASPMEMDNPARTIETTKPAPRNGNRIYRWRNQAGETTYGDSPPPDAEEVVRMRGDLTDQNVMRR